MKYFRPTLGVVIAGALLSSSASAQSAFGGEPDDYLRYGIGARALSMGGAFGPVADDASAIYYNPAGLTNLTSYEVQFMHAPFFQDTNLDSVTAALPLTPYLVFGASGVILRSTGFESRDSSNQFVGNNGQISQTAYMLGAALRFDTFSLGTTVKLLSENVLGYNSQAVGIDVGALMPVTSWLKASASLQNINSPSITLISDKDTFPLRYNAGVSVTFPGKIFLLAAEYHGGTNIGGNTVVAGGELTLAKNFKLRAGVDDQTLPTAGFGVGYRYFTFDYALANHPLGVLHRFGMTAKFGDIFRVKVEPERSESTGGYVPGSGGEEVRFTVETPRFPIDWWRMTILGPDGSEVRRIGGTSFPGSVVSWDLKDAFGRPVREGTYTYEFTVKYRRGDEWTETGSLNVLQSSLKDGTIKMQLDMKGNAPQQ